MAKSLTREEIGLLAHDLRTLLGQIETGELKADSAVRHRIQGALTALEVIQGEANLPDTI
jgi:hypothetical protein